MLAVAVCAFAVLARPAAGQDRVVHEEKDKATGAAVRVYRTSAGPRIEVVTPAVQLRKQLIGDTVVTSLSGPGETLVIEASAQRVSVVGRGGRASATPNDRTQVTKARRLIAESPLAARAAALIGRMGFGGDSAIEPLLLTTRAFLLAARNDESGARDVSEWVRKARSRVQVIKTTFGQRTPTDCWKAYSDELVDAFTDYVDCVDHIHWYDLFGERACAVVYEVRILGAFTWWTGCVSLGGIIGR